MSAINNELAKNLSKMRRNSEALYHRACEVIPSGTVSRARIAPPVPIFVARGEAASILDVDGNEYVDCGMGFGSHILGHAHPVVIDAAQVALKDGTMYGTPHGREAELAELLIEAIPCADKVTFCNSGSEATLNAIRICRAHTGKMGVAKFEGGYHGWYDSVLGSVAGISGPIEDPNFVSHSIGVPQESTAHSYSLPFNNQAAFDKIVKLKDHLAVVMIEGIQGAGGAIPAEREFMLELRKVCTDSGVLLLVDEIITGFRLSFGGAQEFFGVKADIATYSKVIGAGLPLGVICGTEDVMGILGSTGDAARDLREKSYFGGTFNGCVPVMAVGIAVVSHLKEHLEIYGQLNQMGKNLRQRLTELVVENDYPVAVVGESSLFMVRFVSHDVKSQRDLVGENKVAHNHLYPYLCKHGVFIPHGHFGLLSAAHSQQDIQKIVESYRCSLHDMRTDGLL